MRHRAEHRAFHNSFLNRNTRPLYNRDLVRTALGLNDERLQLRELPKVGDLTMELGSGNIWRAASPYHWELVGNVLP